MTSIVAKAAPEEPQRRATGLPIYPIALGGFLLLQLVATGGVGVWVALRPLVIVLLIGIAVTAALRIILGDADRAGPAAAIAMMAIMAGGDRRILVLTFVVIVIFIIERRVLRRQLMLPWRTMNAVGRALTIIVAIAVLLQAVQVGAVKTLARSITHEGILKPVRTFATSTSAATPDIYVLLLDGYARSDALKQVFGVDDQPFIDELRDRGLTVSTHARTNYALTVQVVMSMFHMDLIPNIPGAEPLLSGKAGQTDVGLSHALVQENPLFDYLHAKDYEIHGIASGYAQLSLREADDFITSGNINEFEIAVLRRTILGDLVNAVAPDFISAQYRDRINATWATLGRLAAERPGHPRFVVAHVPSPHPPWVFNADGSPRTSPDTTGLTDAQLKAAYGGSVQALWQPVLRAIDEIDRASTVPPVIVVFGDHGSWIGALPGDIRLRFLPILAARVPGRPNPLPDDESLVNVFPDLLNPLFGASFPRVDPALSFIFGGGGEYDLHPVDDPNGAISTP